MPAPKAWCRTLPTGAGSRRKTAWRGGAGFWASSRRSPTAGNRRSAVRRAKSFRSLSVCLAFGRAMSLTNRLRYQRLLREAEGYLELGLPHLAIETLKKIDQPGTHKGKHLYLLGEAFRAQGRFSEAIEVLQASVENAPSKID